MNAAQPQAWMAAPTLPAVLAGVSAEVLAGGLTDTFADALALGLPATAAPWSIDLHGWDMARIQRWRALVLHGQRGALLLVADRPSDALLLQLAEDRLAAPVRWWTCTPAALDQAIAQASAGVRALDLVGVATNQAPIETISGDLSSAVHDANASPLVRLLDATLHDALQVGASDIHLECDARGAAIHYRIDGLLAPVHRVEGVALAEQMVSRLKVMAELDIGERRLPQDGRFKLRLAQREVDFRLSVMPSVFGEDAVLRVLDRAQIERVHGTLSLAALGFDADLREQLRRLAQAPHGMLLVAGPTGSGKTTTLYAALTETRRDGEKTITIEDPVEYLLPGAVQIPVNERRGLSFARGLRSMLRHDPDRILVGEIRDAETAEIAMQAALTGHVVFSTVHANSAFDVMARFMHMGLDAYHFVSALNGVLAQRLLRELCNACARPLEPNATRLQRLGDRDGVAAAAGLRLRQAVGCAQCRGSGYRGRRAVAELVRMDDTLRDLIVKRAPLATLKSAARDNGLRALHEVALDLVATGVTTLEEADRVTADV